MLGVGCWVRSRQNFSNVMGFDCRWASITSSRIWTGTRTRPQHPLRTPPPNLMSNPDNTNEFALGDSYSLFLVRLLRNFSFPIFPRVNESWLAWRAGWKDTRDVMGPVTSVTFASPPHNLPFPITDWASSELGKSNGQRHRGIYPP